MTRPIVVALLLAVAIVLLVWIFWPRETKPATRITVGIDPAKPGSDRTAAAAQFKCDACGHDFFQPLPVIDAQAIARQAHEAVRGSLPRGARITRPAEVLCQTCVGRLVGAPEALRRRGGL